MYLNILKLDNIPFNQQTTAIFNCFIDTEYHLITTTLSAIYTHMVTMFIREITLNTSGMQQRVIISPWSTIRKLIHRKWLEMQCFSVRVSIK